MINRQVAEAKLLTKAALLVGTIAAYDRLL
jgi:hypothetical protein